MKKTIKILFWNLKNNPLYLICYLKKLYFGFFGKISKYYQKQILFYNKLKRYNNTFLEITKGKSLIRFGDGEGEYLCGGGVNNSVFRIEFDKKIQI